MYVVIDGVYSLCVQKFKMGNVPHISYLWIMQFGPLGLLINDPTLHTTRLSIHFFIFLCCLRCLYKCQAVGPNHPCRYSLIHMGEWITHAYIADDCSRILFTKWKKVIFIYFFPLEFWRKVSESNGLKISLLKLKQCRQDSGILFEHRVPL